jgi:thiamine biosynthesis lipoprotein
MPVGVGVGRATWEALGTSVVLQVTEPSALARAREMVEGELAAVDRACSRFRPDSDLSRVNGARGRFVRVDPLLIEAMQVALRAAELTEGAVDPTLGRALVLAGYDRDWRLMEADRRELRGSAEKMSDPPPAVPRQLIRAQVRSGWKTIEMDHERAMLRVPDGIELDLGATAKAWAADRASWAVHDATGAGVLVALGGDIATAGLAPKGGWRVRVTDDHRSGPETSGQTVSISSGGLATSSTTVRRWRRGDRAMHHIIDPATGEPTTGRLRTVSVAAADCADANIASTAAIVRGAHAREWLDSLGLPARLVDRVGGVGRVCEWP